MQDGGGTGAAKLNDVEAVLPVKNLYVKTIELVKKSNEILFLSLTHI